MEMKQYVADLVAVRVGAVHSVLLAVLHGAAAGALPVQHGLREGLHLALQARRGAADHTEHLLVYADQGRDWNTQRRQYPARGRL